MRFYLAPTLSFCLQGHSCLVGGSHRHVWHPTRGARPPHATAAAAAVPDFLAKGRRTVKTCSSARERGGAVGGEGGLQAKVPPHLPYQRRAHFEAWMCSPAARQTDFPGRTNRRLIRTFGFCEAQTHSDDNTRSDNTVHLKRDTPE